VDKAVPNRKSELRALLLRRRAAQPEASRQAAGEALRARLRDLPALRTAEAVSCYLALPEEMPTAGIIGDLHARGIAVGVPAWDAGRRRYRLAALPPGADVVKGPMRVPEPAVKEWLPMTRFDCLLVPGVAFDERGGRLGFGGGHFDRLLSERRRDVPCVGLAFDFQIVDEVPLEEQDVVMDFVVTPSRVIVPQ
jgi:5-formyltetrahydrofolate cyclo-ligase